MAEKRNAPLVNFVNGEWSPLMAARVDSEDYNKSLAWCQNFVVLPQGGVKYRPGNYLAGLAKTQALALSAYLIPFQFSADDAIIIATTDSTFRFYRDGAVILNANAAITGITQANPGVVTAPAHGYSNGQEVFISGVWGMPQVNDRFFLVAGQTTNTFQLTDQFGNNVDTTTYGAYTANGTVASIYELATPYAEQDLPNLRTAQVGDVMYIVNGNYAPQKLVRSGFTNWSIGTFSRTNDPFAGATYTPIGITKANPGVVTVSSTSGMQNGDTITIKEVAGMTELNKKTFTIQGLTGTTFELYDTNGNPLDTTHYSAFTGNFASNGITDVNNWPNAVAFSSDGRLVYANTRFNPEGLWASELPTGTTTNYDVFTTGTNANNAYAFQFAPVNGVLDSIQEIKQFAGNFALLGASSIRQVYGSSPGLPPNVTAINTLPTIQGAAHVAPLAINWDLLFVDVNQKKLRGLEFNFYYSAFQAVDYNINSEHFGEEAQFIKIVHVKGVPEIVWVLRDDGVLLSFTFDNVTKVQGWARHYVGGDGQVVDITTIRNTDGDDQLYMTVQRTLNGVVYNSIEVLSEWPDIPLKRSFFTGDQTLDRANWSNAAWEQLKLSTFLDMSLTYDGTERGVQAGAALTPSDVTGNIAINSSEPIFQPSDVGSYIWFSYNPDGSGGGQAYINDYVSNTEVGVNVLTNFENIDPVQPGSWSFAIQEIVNLQVFAGQEVDVQADGGAHPSVTVATNGLATLEFPVSMAQFGFGYTGMAATQNLDLGSSTGPGGSKPRNIKRVRVRFSDSVGGQIGSSEYDPEPVVFRSTNQIPNRPPDPHTGVEDMPLLDFWSNDVKQAVILQLDPTPCTVLGLDIEMFTSDAA